MRNINRICLAGDGWGAVAAFNSITKHKNIELELISNDQELIDRSKTYDNVILTNINKMQSYFVVCAGYKKILSRRYLDSRKVINVHYSLLPKYRGFHSTVWAILNDEKELGLTIHRMNEYIDDGPIIMQYKVRNDGISNSKFYMEHFNNWIEKHLMEILLRYFNGDINEIKQDKNCATWVGKRNIEDCRINFNLSHKYIFNFFRALVEPYPIPFVRMKKSKKEYRIKRFELIERQVNTHIGRILNIDAEGLYVSTNEGYMILKELVDDSHNIVPYNNFRIGQYLES